jgi:hypothetical protein
MKTAVEWLVGQLKEYNHLSYDEQSWIFDQAKEIEKQNIIDAFEHFAFNIDDGEQYYNKTFKSE